MVHVLLVPSERYCSPEEPLGGIFQKDQARALRRAGLRVGVIAPAARSLRFFPQRSQTKNLGSYIDEDVPTYRNEGWRWVPGRAPYVASWGFVVAGRKLFAAYVKDHGRPDIIHAHNALYAGVLAADMKQRYGLPFVLTEHSSAYVSKRLRNWQTLLVEHVLRNADQRIVVSPFLGEVMESQFGRVMRPRHAVGNILDGLFETWARGDFPAEKSSPRTILSVGNLVPEKNHSGLLEAFAILSGKTYGVELRIGGAGPLRHKLETRAEQLGIAQKVSFLGLLQRQEVLKEMQKADLFVLPSHYETFGVVLLEALACGTPVVATDCGGPSSIVNAQNGLLVPVNDVMKMAEAMQKALQNLDIYDRQAIRDSCLALFGEEAISRQLRAIYEMTLKP